MVQHDNDNHHSVTSYHNRELPYANRVCHEVRLNKLLLSPSYVQHIFARIHPHRPYYRTGQCGASIRDPFGQNEKHQANHAVLNKAEEVFVPELEGTDEALAMR